MSRTLETVLGSRIVTTFIDRDREYNVILQGRAEDRATPTDLDNLYVRSDRTGELIPLSNLVQAHRARGPDAPQPLRPPALDHGQRRAHAGLHARRGARVRRERRREGDAAVGASSTFDGESREFKQSGAQLYWMFLLALVVVFLVLAAQFESFLHPLVIMTTVPLAVIGALVGLWLYGMSINVFSQIAAIMLVGIAAKNGILIVEFANQLRDRGIEYTRGRDRGRGDPPAARADDQPLHGLRRAAADARDRRRRRSRGSRSASSCSTAW